MAVDTDTFKYWAPVDPLAPNNAHAFSVQLIGHDKHVLELGCAAGHVTTALVAQGCTVVGVEYDEHAAKTAAEIAEEVLIVDLFQADNLTKALEDRQFDVVYCGDVLEHLPDPAGVLTAARRALRPGGTVVISLPNVAHVDVKLALLQGRFDYRDFGLLDATHLRFFTRASILGLLADAGLELAELRRVVRPPFDTEIDLDPGSVPADVLQAALQDPEAETYQFVVKAVPNDGNAELTLAARRYEELDAALGRERSDRIALEAETVALRQRLDDVDQLVRDLHRQLTEAGEAARELEALRATKTFRFTARLRRVYGSVTGRG